MRAQDFLIEGATDVLYHKTSTRSAANILKDGVFKLASSVGTQAEEQYAPPGRPYFLSTSRSKAGDYARWVGSSEVMFNLNGQWLAQRYKVKPIDYWERAWQHSPERTSEGEDRVFSKDPEISIECVTAVHAFIKSADEWRSPYTRQVLLVAKQRGIPAYLYTDPQAWKLQDTRKAVSPQQAAALLKGSTPVRTQYRPASSYLEPWLELIYKKAKSELSPAAEKLRHNLVYYGLRYPNEDSGLASDMNNSRKPDSPDYANVDKLIKFMRANRLAKPADLKNALAQKWDAINTKEQQSAKDQQPVAEDSFNQNFNQINSIITKKYPKEIMNLLLGMFPTAKEAIVNQYKDEDGMPFAEWRRVIWNIDNYVLSGPVVVDGSKLPIDPETEADRLAKYQQYIKDKDSGKPARYFRNNDSDPRTIDFTKLPPITLAQTDAGMDVTDGNHRAFLAKMANKPLRAYVFKRQPNNHPNVAKIKALFSNKQGVAEGLEQNVPPVLYHATYKPRLKSIQLKGLGAGVERNWTDSKRGVVYLALDPDVAESYAETSDMVPDEWLDSIVILKISTAGLDPNKFHIDSNVQDNQGDTVEYHGVIPSSNISLYKQGVAEALDVDVPNQGWLDDARQYARSKGRNQFGVPFMGKITAYTTDDHRVPVAILKHLPGMRSEQSNVRSDDLTAIVKLMKDTGKLPLTDRGIEYAPFINVAHNGEAWVNEGNHRIMAAAALGWKDMPVQIKYFDGGEQIKDGAMYPGNIGL